MWFCELPGLSDWTRDRSALPTEVKTNSAQRWECAANEMFSIKLTVGWHQLRIDRRRLLLGSGRMCFNPKKKMERVSLFASSISENIDIDWSAHHLFFFFAAGRWRHGPKCARRGRAPTFEHFGRNICVAHSGSGCWQSSKDIGRGTQRRISTSSSNVHLLPLDALRGPQGRKSSLGTSRRR